MNLKRIGPYDFVCSIGHTCATAVYLKRHALRTCSSPLDWVGAGPNGFLVHTGVITEGFSHFLRKESLRLGANHLVEGSDDMNHDYYTDAATGMQVIHDFPIGVSFEQAYPEIRAKYDRRIQRFYATIESSRRVLMVFQTAQDHVSDDEIASRLTEIRRRFPKTAVDLLFIESVSGMDGIVQTEPVAGAWHLKGWFYKPEIDRVMGDLKLCDQVYSSILGKGQAWRKLRPKLCKALVRALVSFVPGKVRRHDLREALLRKMRADI